MYTIDCSSLQCFSNSFVNPFIAGIPMGTEAPAPIMITNLLRSGALGVLRASKVLTLLITLGLITVRFITLVIYNLFLTYSTAFLNIAIPAPSSGNSSLVHLGWFVLCWKASGCGIIPKTLPVSSHIPAMLSTEPLGL